MPEVTVKKQMKMIELYLGGLSYDEITRRVGVGKGSVVKVINDLKSGQYPEFIEVVGEVEVLREVAVRLNREGMTPGRASLGFAVWEGLNSSGVNPEEVPKAVALLKALAPSEIDQRQFVQAALYLWDLKEETGKGALELHAWVEGLEERRGKAESLASEVEGLEKRCRGLLEKKARIEKDLGVHRGFG